MTEAELKRRTKRFALDVVGLVDGLPRDRVVDHIGRQMLRCATSVAANYRAACRGRSDAEMAAKLGIVEEECDETQFWLELLVDSGRVEAGCARSLIAEADELLRIVVASIKTLRTRPATRVREPVSDYDLAWRDDDLPLVGPHSPLQTPQ